MLLVTNFVGAELADLISGVTGIAASVIYLKLAGVKRRAEYVNESDAAFDTNLSNFKAFLPYILLFILLPAVRFSFPLSALTKYGYATWIGAVIHPASSAGGSLGNMICPNNIIAVNATLELKNAEGAVFKRTIKAFVIMTAVYCILAMLYAYVFFPEFGM